MYSDEYLFSPVPAEALPPEKKRPPVSYWKDVSGRFFGVKANTVCLAILLTVLAGCLIIPLLNPAATTGVNYDSIKLPPSAKHWFGCDKFGHDIFMMVWKGGRVSFFIGFLAALLQAAIGVVVGAVSSYYGGRVDMVIMRAVDILIAIPYLIIVLAIRVVMGSGMWTIIFALVVTGWMSMARLARGQILQLKNEDYIMAAQSLGVSGAGVLFRHLIPNVLGVVIVQLTLSIPQAMFSEAFLSFIGLGSNADSWGALIRNGMDTRALNPLQLLGASVLLALTMLCVQLIGDGLRDALDPKLRR